MCVWGGGGSVCVCVCVCARVCGNVVHCCFTETTETIMTVRDGEPRTATSTFTQLLSSLAVIKMKELHSLSSF